MIRTAPLMTVADLSDIWVTANVQEKDIHYVHRGDPAVATFAAYSTESFQGKVLFVADVLDPDTRTAKVRIAYPNKDGRLRPAMFANVILKTWDTKELTVPTTALVMSGDRTTVFVQVAANTYEQRSVVPGEQYGDRTTTKAECQAGKRSSSARELSSNDRPVRCSLPESPATRLAYCHRHRNLRVSFVAGSRD